jgi:hypothetical protein
LGAGPEKRNPIEGGRRKGAHHQLLTEDVGHPALAQHLHAVVTLMRVSKTWHQFKLMLDVAHPKRGDTLQLPLMADFATDPISFEKICRPDLFLMTIATNERGYQLRRTCKKPRSNRERGLSGHDGFQGATTVPQLTAVHDSFIKRVQSVARGRAWSALARPVRRGGGYIPTEAVPKP